nr:MAG: hypothetical protein [Totiviridae sp.]
MNWHPDGGPCGALIRSALMKSVYRPSQPRSSPATMDVVCFMCELCPRASQKLCSAGFGKTQSGQCVRQVHPVECRRVRLYASRLHERGEVRAAPSGAEPRGDNDPSHKVSYGLART